jgi:hypothetical protein
VSQFEIAKPQAIDACGFAILFTARKKTAVISPLTTAAEDLRQDPRFSGSDPTTSK